MTVKLMLPESITVLNKNRDQLADAMQDTVDELECLLDRFSFQAALYELRSGEKVELISLAETETSRGIQRLLAEANLKQWEENYSGMREEYRQKF